MGRSEVRKTTRGMTKILFPTQANTGLEWGTRRICFPTLRPTNEDLFAPAPVACEGWGTRRFITFK
jgi:hypothetical protein